MDPILIIKKTYTTHPKLHMHKHTHTEHRSRFAFGLVAFPVGLVASLAAALHLLAALFRCRLVTGGCSTNVSSQPRGKAFFLPHGLLHRSSHTF